MNLPDPKEAHREFAAGLQTKSDADLIALLHEYWGKSEIQEPVQGELTRRQTTAIHDFNRSTAEYNRHSSAWNTRIFWLTVVIGILALAQVLVGVVNLWRA